MLSRIFGKSTHEEVASPRPAQSGLSSLFRSPNEDSLLARARASGNGKDAFDLAEFYFHKEDDNSYIKGAAWLVVAIQRGCTDAEKLFLKDKLFMPSESIPMSGQVKSNALSRCTFVALMLLNKPLPDLLHSGWIESWKVENRPKFAKFNQDNSYTLLLSAIASKDEAAAFMLHKSDDAQNKIFNLFFSYCFTNSFIDERLKDKLGVTYSPPQGNEHKETTSLLGAGSSCRRTYS